jgi:hypothetical protein
VNMQKYCILEADKCTKQQAELRQTRTCGTSSKNSPIHCRPCKRHVTSCKDLPLRPPGGLLRPPMGAKRLANGFARSSDLPAGGNELQISVH